MVKVGDWVVVIGLSDYKDYHEGKVIRIHGKLADIWLEETGAKWNVNVKYLRKIKKEVDKQDLINASLDLKIKDWFMSLTGERND